MRGRRTLALIGVIVVGVALIGAVLWWRQRAAPPPAEQVTPEAVPAVSVVIARNTLDRGTLVEQGMVATVAWPRDLLPPSYFTDTARVVGLVVRGSIPQGTPLIPAMLAEGPVEPEARASELALTGIPEGMRALAVPMDMLAGVAWLIEPGDHVDVLASWTVSDLDEEFQTLLPNRWRFLQCPEGYTCEGTMGRMELLPTGDAVLVFPTDSGKVRYVAQTTIQDAVVLAVVPFEPPPPPPEEAEEEAGPPPAPAPTMSQAVVLLVDAQESLVLKALLEHQANIELALRGVQDYGVSIATAPVTLEYIVDNYGVELPPKLPYTLWAPPVSALERALQNRALGEVQGGAGE